jgi:HEAT repeat protein
VQAVQSIQKLVREMPQEHIITYLWPVLQRCAFRDWYTSRCSACGLIARMYSRLGFRPAGVTASVVAALEAKSAGASETSDEEFASMPVFKEDMVLLYQRLSGDETPMVRRACSSVMPDVGTAIAEGTLTTPDAFDNLSSVTPHGTMSDAKMIEDTGTVLKSGSADGYNVDTGDVTAGAVPPPVPSPIFISAATQEHGARATQTLLPILQTFARDDQDSVRLLAVDNCVALARLVNGTPQSVADGSDAAVVRLSRYSDLRSQVLATFNTLAGDRSWRVRWSVANRLGEVSDAAGPTITADHVLPVFERLMVDAEAEVRTAAAYRVSDIGRLASRERIIAAILPCVDKLSEDSSEHVRAALASVILGIAPVLGEEATISMLLPIFLRLLRDTSAQVRLNIISKLEAVNAVIGLKMLSQSLLPAIGELSSDKQWRVRLAIIDFMPLLARQLGVEFFDVELTNLCIKWLTDSVYAIRDAAATNLRKLAEVFGSEWAHTVLIPRVVALKGEGSYQCRMTSLNAAVVSNNHIYARAIVSPLPLCIQC